ncbi:MAG: hypothetical protein PHU75_07800 [Candidatus Nanopelagicales bacterium]|nr:hypothetical protein [Candidatus Nanopelagicales bacterium]
MSTNLVTLGGLPLHPLVVHLVVVIVPLTALGAVLMAVHRNFSRRFGVLVAIGGLVSIGSAVLAKEAGEQLARVVAVTADHYSWGSRAPIWIGLFGLSAIGFWAFERGIPANRPRPVWLRIAAGVVVLLAILATIAVIGAGHSGSEGVWSQLIP